MTAIADFWNKPAVFSDDREYRYSLRRDSPFEDARLPALFILLNPSTADETKDDQTVAKCRHFAKQWGNGLVLVANIFALRATDPKVMRGHPHPVSAGDGIVNDFAISAMAHYVAERKGKIVCAWGAHGTHLNRAQEVVELLDRHVVTRMADLWCFGKTRNSGQPLHPCRLGYDRELQRWP